MPRIIALRKLPPKFLATKNVVTQPRGSLPRGAAYASRWHWSVCTLQSSDFGGWWGGVPSLCEPPIGAQNTIGTRITLTWPRLPSYSEMSPNLYLCINAYNRLPILGGRKPRKANRLVIRATVHSLSSGREESSFNDGRRREAPVLLHTRAQSGVVN